MKKARLNIYLDDDVIQKLRALAKRESRSMAGQAVYIIKRHLEKIERERADET